MLFSKPGDKELNPDKPKSKPRNPVPGKLLRPTEDFEYAPPGPPFKETPSLEDTPLELLEKVYDGYLKHVFEIRELKDDLGHIKVGVRDLISWKLRHEALHIDITTRIENRLKTFKKSIDDDLKPLIDSINSLNSKVQILEKFIEPKVEYTKNSWKSMGLIPIEYCSRCKQYNENYGCMKKNTKDYPECFEEIKSKEINCHKCREYDRCDSKEQTYVTSNGIEFKADCFKPIPEDNCFNCRFINKGSKQCWRLNDGKYYEIRYSYSEPCDKRKKKLEDE